MNVCYCRILPCIIWDRCNVTEIGVFCSDDQLELSCGIAGPSSFTKHSGDADIWEILRMIFVKNAPKCYGKRLLVRPSTSPTILLFSEKYWVNTVVIWPMWVSLCGLAPVDMGSLCLGLHPRQVFKGFMVLKMDGLDNDTTRFHAWGACNYTLQHRAQY